MSKEIKQIRIFKEDRNFIETIKRKLDDPSFAITINKIIKLFKQNKLHLDLIK